MEAQPNHMTFRPHQIINSNNTNRAINKGIFGFHWHALEMEAQPHHMTFGPHHIDFS